MVLRDADALYLSGFPLIDVLTPHGPAHVDDIVVVFLGLQVPTMDFFTEQVAPFFYYAYIRQVRPFQKYVWVYLQPNLDYVESPSGEIGMILLPKYTPPKDPYHLVRTFGKWISVVQLFDMIPDLDEGRFWDIARKHQIPQMFRGVYCYLWTQAVSDTFEELTTV